MHLRHPAPPGPLNGQTDEGVQWPECALDARLSHALVDALNDALGAALKGDLRAVGAQCAPDALAMAVRAGTAALAIQKLR